MLFVDAGNNRIGIGTNSPSVLLDLESTAPVIRFTDSDASGTPECEISGTGGDVIIRADRDNEKSSSVVSFEIDGSEKMKVDDTGDVTITDGDLVVANGHGIDFSATSDGGSQGFSELLDDYEEGYWTPVYESGSTNPSFSANLQDGRYTKIGRLVYASFRLRGAITGTKTGGLIIAGLPFTSNSSAANGSGGIGLTEAWGSDNYPSNLRVAQSSNYIQLMTYDSSDPRDGVFTNVTVSSTGTGSGSNYIIGHVVYQE